MRGWERGPALARAFARTFLLARAFARASALARAFARASVALPRLLVRPFGEAETPPGCLDAGLADALSLGLRVWGMVLRVSGSGFMVYGLWFMGKGSGLRV